MKPTKPISPTTPSPEVEAMLAGRPARVQCPPRLLSDVLDVLEQRGATVPA